ncbi:aspartyl-phosphate phosphatase Spo0E family protein [Metabacillus sp. HB246100]|uniref:aspartyl-phosphate phosphatase Spo0E family protein n=1 Tax=Bacillus weihaiensis TaxID=1547283 RepID=UPI00235685C6|nr:aspartyl-phosphate phosphatase Spo0E family protein [Bacillus weihaiensis]
MINEIEQKRKHLIKTAKIHGMNSHETIQCSQELDVLLLQQIKKTNDKYIQAKELTACR